MKTAATPSGTVGRARRPPPAEHSIAVRAGATGAVAVGIAACAVQHELTWWFAATSLALLACGHVLSHRRRAKPLPYLKPLLGAAMVGAFAWFFVTVASVAPLGGIASVEPPLAALLTAMQAAHAFDVPTRRDLGIAVAGSATLMAVAAAQAIDLRFGVLVVAWAACAVLELTAAWGSMAGAIRLRAGGVAAAVAAVVAVAALMLAVGPGPRSAGATGGSGGLGPAGLPPQPSHLVPGATSSPRAASASGPTGVGGFLGFSGPLDTAVRASLGSQVVMRVRADRPTFWLAETFDRWSGQSWTQSPTGAAGGRRQVLDGGQPFVLPATSAYGSAQDGPQPPGPATASDEGAGAAQAGAAQAGAAQASQDYQTFYLAAPASDLVLHASIATVVWFPGRRLYLGGDGTIRAATSLGAGSVYSVLSTVDTPTPAQLRGSSGTSGLTRAARAADLQLPHAYPRVAALARRVTEGTTSTYAKIRALERWIGAHTRYTTHIPPLAPGQDTVDQFLFGTRRGYCEQISTSLAVMLRTLGIPAREAAGYVPGQYDPITGVYDVEARDAHAWVQVWFPRYGWQGFDPTAYVPLATPSAGGALARAVLAALARVPVVPAVAILGCLLAAIGAVMWRRHRPATWRAAVTRHLVAAARHARADVRAGDTLGAIGARLDDSRGARRGPSALDVALTAELAAWSGREPGPAVARSAVSAARRIRADARRTRRRSRLPGRSPRRGTGGSHPAGSPRSGAGVARARPRSEPGVGGTAARL